MPILFQLIVKREDARRNPKTLYVFGDNLRRVGYGGQARELRGEKNAVGVATKYAPYDCFTEDIAAVIAQKRIIDTDMKPLYAHIKKGGTIVWPSRGIGTGLADLANNAPSTASYLEDKLASLIRMAKMFDRGDYTEELLETLEQASPHIQDRDLKLKIMALFETYD